MGCPIACGDAPKVKAAIANQLCVDEDKDSPNFQSYLNAVKIAIDGYPSGQASFAEPVQAALIKDGCNAASAPIDTYGYFVDLCDEFNFFHWKPINLICPVACKCNTKTREYPQRCP